jgi:hypothetical protein
LLEFIKKEKKKMELEYKGRTYHLTTIVDIEGTTWGIVAIYEMTYKYFKENGEVIEVSSEDYDKASEEGEDVPSMDLRYIDYFWQDTEDIEELKKEAFEVIDNYNKKERKLGQLLARLENHLRGLNLPKNIGLSELLEQNETTQDYLFDILEILLERIA